MPGTALVLSPQPMVIFGTVTPAAPMEPSRRVTASRGGGRSDLPPRHAQHGSQGGYRRGRLLDLLV
jgi:hypothetical protein